MRWLFDLSTDLLLISAKFLYMFGLIRCWHPKSVHICTLHIYTHNLKSHEALIFIFYKLHSYIWIWLQYDKINWQLRHWLALTVGSQVRAGLSAAVTQVWSCDLSRKWILSSRSCSLLCALEVECCWGLRLIALIPRSDPVWSPE